MLAIEEIALECRTVGGWRDSNTFNLIQRQKNVLNNTAGVNVYAEDTLHWVAVWLGFQSQREERKQKANINLIRSREFDGVMVCFIMLC